MNPFDKLERCLESVRSKVDFVPRMALILGSGLGSFADDVMPVATLPYNEIAGFPISTAPGHKGRFVFAHIEGVPTVIMQGRVHYYEGYSMQDVALPTRLMGMLGAKAILLTNAAGAVNYSFESGDFMLLSDQIASFVPSPLIGTNPDKLGVRFPDMSEIYNKELRRTVRRTAAGLGIPLREGVYMQLTGPHFESPAEIRMYRTLGADAVGMSTACEAIAANHMGLKVCGISCISNLCSGMTNQPLSSEEVEETASLVAPQFKQLVTSSIAAIDKAMGL